jgi:hypothetical protein
LIAVLWHPGDRAAAAGGTESDALPADTAANGIAPATPGAEDAAAPMFRAGGFGTLGVVHSSDYRADFTATAFEGTGAGNTRRWSPAVDSLVALQADGRFNSKVSGVLQVVVEQNYNATYWPQIEWANIRYEFTPDFSLSIGRTELAVFMLTDSRRIGYANPWVRPPVEVYSLLSVDSNDGIAARYRWDMAGGTDTFQVAAGRTDPKFPPANAGGGSGSAHVRRQVALDNTFELGATTLRVNYYQSRVTVPNLESLFEPFREFGPPGIAIADRLDVNRSLFTFLDASASYDPGKWFAMGEWARIKTHSVLGENSGWFVSAGYHFGAVTPFATYARVKANSSTSDAGLDAAAVPPYLQGSVMFLNSTLNATLRDLAVQRTVSVGGRWDFMKNVDAKMQFDHTNLGNDSAGTLRNLAPGFQPGSAVNIFSATVDFVF